MSVIYFSFIVDAILIFILAFLIDATFGEYPDRAHPTIGIGKIIKHLKFKAKSLNPKIEKINGILLSLTAILVVSLPMVLLFWIRQSFGSIPYIILGAVLLKATFAVKGMGYYTKPISKALKKGDLAKARKWLPFIVRRDPNELNEKQIISAAVESIAESTTDGITSPFFYYALFGVPGAFAYRVINTLDSMVGYKTLAYKNIGWFSAKLDTLANYIPSRLTAILMVIASGIVRENMSESWRILKRDKNKTASPNAGWTISAMAGALNIQLEKQGYYVLGDDHAMFPEHIYQALKIMAATAVLFGLLVVGPFLALRFFAVGF
jgi:adenosylcobinamide-phosphate synthase